MAGGLNKVMVIGNVGRDPEMRYTPSGSAVTTFSVAVTRRWNTPQNEPREETEWFNIVAWDKLAETCNQLVTKGRRVYIEGRLQTRSWDDKETGQKRYRTEVIANQVLFLDRVQGAGGFPDSGGMGMGGDIDPDDLPFEN